MELVILNEIARIQVVEGKDEPAGELLGIVLNHPACSQQVREEAGEILSHLQSQADPLVIAQALERGRAKKLEVVVEALLCDWRQSAGLGGEAGL